MVFDEHQLHKVEPSSTFCNNFFQFATMKFVARQVKHTVVIRAITRSTYSATMLRDRLNKNVARITGRSRRPIQLVIHFEVNS